MRDCEADTFTVGYNPDDVKVTSLRLLKNHSKTTGIRVMDTQFKCVGAVFIKEGAKNWWAIESVL